MFKLINAATKKLIIKASDIDHAARSLKDFEEENPGVRADVIDASGKSVVNSEEFSEAYYEAEQATPTSTVEWMHCVASAMEDGDIQALERLQQIAMEWMQSEEEHMAQRALIEAAISLIEAVE